MSLYTKYLYFYKYLVGSIVVISKKITKGLGIMQIPKGLEHSTTFTTIECLILQLNTFPVHGSSWVFISKPDGFA
jgi:hypothetical protein